MSDPVGVVWLAWLVAAFSNEEKEDKGDWEDGEDWPRVGQIWRQAENIAEHFKT